MDIPTTLLRRVLLDVGLQSLDTIDLDYREICSRYEHEGMSFLTITLPRLDDVLLKGLSTGCVTRDDFVGFRPCGRNGSLPALLSGFFLRVFNRDGTIKDMPDIDAIYAIRQVSRLFKKVELPCSEQRVKAAYERYVSTDSEVDWRVHRNHFDVPLWRSVCGILWSDLEDASGHFYCAPGVFGKGATAEKSKLNERASILEWPVRSEGSFPSSYHAVVREDSDHLAKINYLAESDERPVRVVQVPKTLKTPRTISVEPSYMMLMQQSVAKPLMVYLESKRFGFRSIRFVDQSINRRLARVGSIDGSLATIDLKDASDRVDNDLVKDIFSGCAPTFLQLIQDCRSTRAQLPDGSLLPLRKFASMGSALCFPIEAMVFFTVVMYALTRSSGKLPSRRLLLDYARDVAIYGDDIIVKSSMAPVIMETLEDFGLKVNHDKSFHTGLFRESCGGDYYAGVDVTPVYVRQWNEQGALTPSQMGSAAALSNLFYMKGLWNAADHIRRRLESRVGRIPRSRHPIGVLHFVSFRHSDMLRYDRDTHGYRVKGLMLRSKDQADTAPYVDGNLICAFQSSEHNDWLHAYETLVNRKVTPEYDRYHGIGRCDDRYLGLRPRGRVPSWDNPTCTDELPSEDPRVCGPECTDARQGRTHQSQNWAIRRDVYNEPTDRRRPYSDMSYDECRDVQKVIGHLIDDARADRTLSHFRVRKSNVTTSAKPHALCSKRAWTSTPEGLSW